MLRPDQRAATDQEIAVWTWDLDQPIDGVSQHWLDPAERQRAERFVFEKDRHRYIAAHCGMRRLLALCTGQAPRSLAFRVNAWGKPALIRHGGMADIRFSLSHSGAMALLAVTEAREIGADIEQVRPVSDGIAERFFAGEEVMALKRLAPAEEQQGFCRIWSSKEAVIKSIGLGLSLALDSFAVSIDDPPRVLRLPDLYGAPGNWELSAFVPVAGYWAALALAPDGFVPPV